MENSNKTENAPPLPTGFDGRDINGQFAAGNTYGQGCPHAKALAHWRRKLLEAASDEDFTAVYEALVEQAKLGKGWAIREFFNRMCGYPLQGIHAEIEDRRHNQDLPGLTDAQAAKLAAAFSEIGRDEGVED